MQSQDLEERKRGTVGAGVSSMYTGELGSIAG